MTKKKIAEFSDRLNYLIESSAKSAAQIAADFGIAKQTLSSWVTGKRSPKSHTVAALADYFDVDVAWLSGYDVPQSGKSNVQDAPPWSAPLVDAYAAAVVPKQEAVCSVLQIPHVSVGEPPTREMIELPYFDEAPAAGSPTDAEGHFEMMAFPADEVPTGTSFVTHINGDSMEPTLPDHCYIFVRETKELRNNQIGVFGLDSGFVCKRARIDVCGQVHALMSDNPKYSDITGDELLGFRPIGEVLGDYCEE